MSSRYRLRKNDVSGRFPVVFWKAKAEIPLNVLGVNIDLLEVLFLSRFILPSWDKVAQGTRIQLERAQKGRQDGEG